jgi:hypothetical protein
VASTDLAALGQPCGPRIVSSALTPPIPGQAKSIVFYDDGTAFGPAFYAAGWMPRVGHIARLRAGTGGAGSVWETVGEGTTNAGVEVLAVIEDGSGPGGRPGLYAGGSRTDNRSLSRWDGVAWQLVLPSPGADVKAIVLFPGAASTGGSAGVLHVLQGQNLRKLDGGEWRTVATIQGGGHLLRERVHVYDEDGPAGPRPPAMFFVNLLNASYHNGVGISHVAAYGRVVRWDGEMLASLLPSGMQEGWVKCAHVFDDGHGSSLYIAAHEHLNSDNPGPVMRWVGHAQAWMALTPGPAASSPPYALIGFADGAGPLGRRLYGIGRHMSIAGGHHSVAAWDGRSWSPLADGSFADHAQEPFHYLSAVGTLGSTRLPAVLCTRGSSAISTSVFGIVGCPRCLADTNLDGQATLADLFAFIDDYFIRHPAADFNGSGTVTEQDVSEFIGAYFVGCG